jgi:hypothetical protein
MEEIHDLKVLVMKENLKIFQTFGTCRKVLIFFFLELRCFSLHIRMQKCLDIHLVKSKIIFLLIK